MPLGFFEKVPVTNSRRFPECNGKTGVVRGISEEDGNVYGYSVHFAGEPEGCFLLPEELEGTGVFAEHRDFYDHNDRVYVRVDGDKGSVVE